MSKILFLGDIRVENDAVSVDPAIKELCRNSTLVIANLEGPVVRFAEPRQDKKGVHHSNGDAIRELAKDLDVGVFLFGNNHIYDYADGGLAESIDFCSANGIAWVGARHGTQGRCCYKNEELKVCIYSFAHREGPVSEVNGAGVGPFALPDTQVLCAEIEQYVRQSYKVFVVYHGGEEYFNTPWPRRLGWFAKLADSGASLVIGTHSHSIQPVYCIKQGQYLATGIGNTYFDSEGQRRNAVGQDGMAILFDTKDGSLSLFKLKSNFEQKSLALEPTNRLSPRNIALESLVLCWADESRLSITGRLNRVPSSSGARGGWKRFARPPYVFLLFFKRVLSPQRNLRDVDIFISATPFLGKQWAKRIFFKGNRQFKF